MSCRKSPFRRARVGSSFSARCILIAAASLAPMSVGPLLSITRAQPLPSESADRPFVDDDEQTLHDPASLGREDAAAPAPTDAESATAEFVAIPEPAPKRNLLEEKLAEGEGLEAGTLGFDSEESSFVLVTTKPHFTRLQAKNELDRLILEAADERYQAAVHSPRVGFWFPLDLAYVRGELLLPDGEQYRRNHEERYVGHALLAFDEPFERRLRAVRVASRSMQIVAAGGTAIALLIVAFAFLRLDRATRGLYTGRLQTWAVVACAVVACIAGFVAYWIPWI